MRRFAIPIGCACLLGIAGCAAHDMRQADIQAVRAVEADWAHDATLKDPEKLSGYYAPDAMLLMPNAPILTGRDNIQSGLAGMMRDPAFAFSFQAMQADASKGGGLVYTVGTYSLTRTDPKDGKPFTDKGKYMTVYKKQADGEWKAEANSINSDLPGPGPSH